MNQEAGMAALGTLVLVGSCAPQARIQAERLADEGALVLTIPREAVLNQDESYLMGIRSGAAAAIKAGRNVIIRSENWPEALLVTRKLAARRGIAVDELERRVRLMLARAARGVIEAAGTRQLIGLGTETCTALREAMGITEVVTLEEAAPELPVLQAQGEPPLLLVLKSGTSGEPDALVRAAGHLRQKVTGPDATGLK